MPGLYQDKLLSKLALGVRSLLDRWQLSAQTELSLLCISENATFRADDPKRKSPVVIRVHRPGYHSELEIESELQWIASLREQAVVTTPRPLPMRDGKLIASFQHDNETRHVVAFEFMTGHEPDESGDLSHGFQQLGQITARLHQHTQAWQRSKNFERKTWNFATTIGHTPHWGDWRHGQGLNQKGLLLLQQCIDLLQQQLNDYGTDANRFGLIHADLRLANLLVDERQLTVIDFDDCGFGWYMYDFAAAISFIETSPQIPALKQAWVEGYRSVSLLSDTDVEAIPMFIMLRRILLTAWIASHAETPTAQQLGSDYTDGTVKLATQYLEGNC
jgi:Ser/Thr protein kinase RdoA (MazF antagonist)